MDHNSYPKSFTLETLGSKILVAANSPVGQDEFSDEFRGYIHRMYDAMLRLDGIGLAAPQVGISKRIFIIHRNYAVDGHWFFANPTITYRSSELCSYTEGCLSLPGLQLSIDRPSSISVDAQDMFGAQFSISNVSGFHARVIQHENDHLDGVLMPDRLDNVSRMMISNKLKLIRRARK